MHFTALCLAIPFVCSTFALVFERQIITYLKNKENGFKH